MRTEGIPSDCPALRTLLVREEEVLAASVCEGEKAEYREYTDHQIELLRQAADIVGCPQLDKSLPSSDEMVPPFGTIERADFANRCPAAEKYRELIRRRQ
jgi:hypothetical protein